MTNEEVRQDVKYDQMNAVGFHIPGAFDKVLAIEKCWLQDDISNRIRNAVRDYAYEHDYSFINLRTQEGIFAEYDCTHLFNWRTDGNRHLQDYGRSRNGTVQAVTPIHVDSFPEITSLLYIINNKCNDTINDLDVHVFKGKITSLKKWRDCVSK